LNKEGLSNSSECSLASLLIITCMWLATFLSIALYFADIYALSKGFTL